LNSLIKTDDVPNVLSELDTAFFDIPFENSDFQNTNFVMAAQITPARAYRAIGLRMFAKIRAVKEYLINKEMTQIDIDEWNAKIDNPDTNEFDRRRARIELIKIQEGEKWGEKLLNDALRELTCLYTEFKKFPAYTREQFEAEESAHFQHKLNRQLTHGGAQESLVNMNVDAPSFDNLLAEARAMLALKD
jgi:hypothetical protein